jgi:hypothetical protein
MHTLQSINVQNVVKKTRFKRKAQRTVFTTFGNISFQSPQFYCSKCKSYYWPYDTALNLRKGKYQYDFQLVLSKLAANQTFEETSQRIAEIYGYEISQDTVYELTNEYADDVRLTEIIPTREEIKKVVEAATKGKRRRPILVFAVDGAMAPIRTGKGKPNVWKEVKGIRIYLLDNKKIVHLISWHQIANKEQFREFLANLKEEDLFPMDKIRMCCIADGAEWIWDTVVEFFPDCRRILDYYHCTEHLHRFASLKYRDEVAAKEWVEQTKIRLFHNNVRQVISGLKRMKCSHEVKKKGTT